MTRVIWKFQPELINESVAACDMPVGARVLTAREQGRELCLWAEVDPAAELERRLFYVIGTGHALPKKVGGYIGTVMLYSDTLVLHVYHGGT